MVLEGCSLRQAWTRCRQLPADAMGRLGWVLVIFFVLGVLLTNLLCMVGITGVYWEERGREESGQE